METCVDGFTQLGLVLLRSFLGNSYSGLLNTFQNPLMKILFSSSYDKEGSTRYATLTRPLWIDARRQPPRGSSSASTGHGWTATRDTRRNPRSRNPPPSRSLPMSPGSHDVSRGDARMACCRLSTTNLVWGPAAPWTPSPEAFSAPG